MAVAANSAIWYTLPVRLLVVVLLAMAVGQATAVPSSSALEICAASCADDDASGRCAPSCLDCTCCGHAVTPFVACGASVHVAALSAHRVGPDVASGAPKLDGHDVFHVPRTSLA